MQVTVRYGKVNAETNKRGELVIDTESGEVHIGATTLTVDEWKGLEYRVDKCLTRAGFLEKPKPAPTPVASKFIMRNLPALNRVSDGVLKDAPLLLRPFYSKVVTKEKLNGYDSV